MLPLVTRGMIDAVRDPEPLDAPNLQVRVDDGIGVDAHAAGAGGMLTAPSGGSYECTPVIVRDDRFAGERFTSHVIRHGFRFHDLPGVPGTGDEVGHVRRVLEEPVFDHRRV